METAEVSGETEPAVAARESVGKPEVYIVEVFAGEKSFGGKLGEGGQLALVNFGIAGAQRNNEGHYAEGVYYHEKGYDEAKTAVGFLLGDGLMQSVFSFTEHASPQNWK